MITMTMLLFRLPTTAAAAAAAARGTRSLSSSCAAMRHSKCSVTLLLSCKSESGSTNSSSIYTLTSSICSNRSSSNINNSSSSTRRRHLSSFSRMLDMGGAPSAMHDKSSSIKIQTSKNCKIQAICFDFEVLTTASSLTTTTETPLSSSSSQPVSTISGAVVMPDVNMIHQVASLLNVKLEGSGIKESAGAAAVVDDADDDDLSLLTGDRKISNKDNNNNSIISRTNKTAGPLAPDIRQKYANKLYQRGVEGGVASVELAKHQVQETLKKGDAAGHLAARKMVAAEPVGSSSSLTSGNRWMAQTGTGALLQYLSQRSLKLGLLPRPGLVDDKDNKRNKDEQGQRMQNFQKQLPDVTFDVMMLDRQQEDDDGSVALDDAETIVAKTTLQPELVLLVSDRDDYLKAAKEAGMVACRIRLPNARRGNVSTHYTVSSIPEVQEVVNEINGISYKAVLQGR
jgi:hypothetical protein